MQGIGMWNRFDRSWPLAAGASYRGDIREVEQVKQGVIAIHLYFSSNLLTWRPSISSLRKVRAAGNMLETPFIDEAFKLWAIVSQQLAGNPVDSKENLNLLNNSFGSCEHN